MSMPGKHASFFVRGFGSVLNNFKGPAHHPKINENASIRISRIPLTVEMLCIYAMD